MNVYERFAAYPFDTDKAFQVRDLVKYAIKLFVLIPDFCTSRMDFQIFLKM